MSLGKNITASYIGQIYLTLAGMLTLPLYLRYMGAEAYGLVGFFSMLQVFFSLLDLGLTPTIARETARYHGGGMPAPEYRQLYRMLSVIFFGMGVSGGTGLFLFSEFLAAHWLNLGTIPVDEATSAVEIMAVSVAMRWMSGLYRGVISGSEQLVWLNASNIIISTMKFIMVLPVMWYFGFTAVVFFIYQLIVAVMEILLLGSKSRSLLPRVSCQKIGWSFKPVQGVLRFALTIALTSSIWVLITQTDKLVLSGVLPLDEYGYFTLAVLVANGIMMIGGPVSNAIIPRMAKLHAQGKYQELIHVYRESTKIITIVAGSAAITIVVCAEQLLFAWTGDADMAIKTSSVLRLYAIGNGLLVLGAFPYYLQYARGNLKYHLISNISFAVILIPCFIFAAYDHGGLGAGFVWMGANAVYLFFGVAYIHHKLEPGLHLKWIWQDIIKTLLPGVVLPVLFTHIPIELGGNRLSSLIFVILVGCSAVLGAGVISAAGRNRLFRIWKHLPYKPANRLS